MSTTRQRKEMPLPSLPDGIPTAAAYRLSPELIDHTVCVGRVLSEEHKDIRWKPAAYLEKQCGKDVITGTNLCSICTKRQEKAAESGKHGAWNGRVTEDPPPWCHMLGTAYAAKCKWTGGDDASSVSSSKTAAVSSSNAAAAPPPVPDLEAENAALRAALADKEAELEDLRSRYKARDAAIIMLAMSAP